MLLILDTASRRRCLLRLATRWLAGLALLALLSAPLFARVASAAEGVTRVRLGVTADGIVRVTAADLAVAGVDPAAVDPRTFALSSLGQPVAIRVTGEADGRFDAGDAIEFFGERFRGPEMQQKYTDERVYWLEVGGAPGPRIPDVDATPHGDLTPPADFSTTLRAEESNIWWTLYTLYMDTQDTWFWDRLQPQGSKGVTRSLPYVVPDPAPGFPATLRVEEISRKWSDSVTPDHRTTIGLNSQALADATWDGQVRQVFTMTAPAGLLVSGVNTVTVGAQNLPGVTSDDVYVNYWELDYRRQFRAWQGQLDFRAEAAGPQEYRITGLPAPAAALQPDPPSVYPLSSAALPDPLPSAYPLASVAEIWDISDPARPVRLVGATTSVEDAGVAAPAGRGGETRGLHEARADWSAALFAVSAYPLSSAARSHPLPSAYPLSSAAVHFRVTGAVGSRYWLQAAGTISGAASVRLRPPTGLRDPAGGADVVIVTPAVLRDAAERLAVWHRAHGRRALVADIQDVYDEFNDGILHPGAAPAMLAWAQEHWAGPAPAYLTLMGDGHWNFKGYNPADYPPEPIPIPPYLAWLDPVQGEVPADTLYGDITGDGLPDVAVGRLAVNTLAEAQTVVDKIIAYDPPGSNPVRAASWQRRAVFIADNADGRGDFAAVSDQIIHENLPADLIPERIYLGLTVPDGVSAQVAISDALQSGAWMVQYAGHGAPERWASEQIWRTSDVPGLRNGERLPVVMTFNCLDGYFAYPARPSIAETMQRQVGGGSIAAISPSGLGLTPDQQRFRQILMDVLFRDGVQELGRALTLTKDRYYQQYGWNYLLGTMMLYGDPAMRLPRGLAWQYLPLGVHTSLAEFQVGVVQSDP